MLAASPGEKVKKSRLRGKRRLRAILHAEDRTKQLALISDSPQPDRDFSEAIHWLSSQSHTPAAAHTGCLSCRVSIMYSAPTNSDILTIRLTPIHGLYIIARQPN